MSPSHFGSSMRFDSRSTPGSRSTSPESLVSSRNLRPKAAISNRGEQVAATTRRNATRRLHHAPINGVALKEDGPLGAACSEDGTITVFDLMTCKAIRRLNGDPEPLGRRPGVSAWAVGELLQSRSAGARRVALQAMPMVAERGDDAAIAAVAHALEKGGGGVRETCLDLFSQLIIPGDQRALRRVAGLLQHSDEAVREAGRKAAFMVLENAAEVERVELMATKMRESKGAQGIETPLTITAQMVVELGEEMGGISEEEQARVLRLWDGSEDWGMKITILAALDASKDALIKGDTELLLKMVSHPLEAVRIVARELLGMVAFDGTLVSGNQNFKTVEGILAALMEKCVRDDVGMAAEGCTAVSRVLSGAFARRAIEMQPQIAADRAAKAAEARERARITPVVKAGVYKGNKFSRK